MNSVWNNLNKRQWVAIGMVVAVILVLLLRGKSELITEQPQDTTTPIESVTQAPGTASPAKWGQVKFQTKVQIKDANYFPPNPDYQVPERHWKVGVFTDGPYKGADLILVEYTEEGPGGPVYLHFVKNSSTLTLLERNSSQYWSSQAVTFQADPDYAIGELIAPQIIQSPDGAVTLELGSFGGLYSDGIWEEQFAKANLVKVFTDSKSGDVFTDVVPKTSEPETYVRYGFYVHLPDDLVVSYGLKIPFVSGENTQITWDDNNYASQYFYQPMGGCGTRGFLNVVLPSKFDFSRDLVKAGRASNGDTVFQFKDSQHPYLKEIYETGYYPPYPATEKIPYGQFVKMHPVFFWYDPYGRLVQFQSKDFMIQAECGKPVIYLYPEQAQQVSVQVQPQGGMTYSDPAYGQGWNVLAQPDGQLTEVSSGRPYPYLFWEGRGGMYQRPGRGWVVAQSEVKSLIDEKLKAFGLIDQEIADFEEFWLPKMQSAPYYFVTFMGKRYMDELAPLTVQPQPDTVIRVLMDYQPLSAPRAVQGFAIHTPERRGFTVVEWGGVLGR